MGLQSLKLLDRVQERAKKLVTEGSLEHQYNVECALMFFPYNNGMCSSEIRELLSDNRTFLSTTRWSIDQKIALCTTERNRSPKSSYVVSSSCFTFNMGKFKSNVRKHYSIYSYCHNLGADIIISWLFLNSKQLISVI